MAQINSDLTIEERVRLRVLKYIQETGTSPTGRVVVPQLRSEKVRNIIGQVPPVLLQYGIMIIGVSLLVLIGVSAFIPYQQSIGVEIKIIQTDDGELHYSSYIPQSAMRDRAKFTEVKLNLQGELPLPILFQIENISDVVEISGMKAWQMATLRPIESEAKSIYLDKPINMPGKILLEKQSVMMWVVRKVRL